MGLIFRNMALWCQMARVRGISGLVEKPDANAAPSNLASIGRYVLTPDIFDTLRGLSAGSGGEIQLADAINIHAQRGSVETRAPERSAL